VQQAVKQKEEADGDQKQQGTSLGSMPTSNHHHLVPYYRGVIEQDAENHYLSLQPTDVPDDIYFLLSRCGLNPGM
jgi:hypothetical protein